MDSDSVALAVETDRAAYVPGEPVEFVLTLRNTSEHTIHLSFSDSQRYDFRIVDLQNGGELWRWGADRMFAQVLGTERLDPEEPRRWREVYEGDLPPGEYEVEGIVPTDEETFRSTASFRVK